MRQGGETKLEFFMDHEFDTMVNGRFSQALTVKSIKHTEYVVGVFMSVYYRMAYQNWNQRTKTLKLPLQH